MTAVQRIEHVHVIELRLVIPGLLGEARKAPERLKVYEEPEKDQVAVMQENRIEGMHNTSAGDPTQQLREKAKNHEAEAEEMDFIADHVLKGETYLLCREDLVKLGITRSRY